MRGALRSRGAPLLASMLLAGCAPPLAPRILPPAPSMDVARISRDIAWLAADARDGRGRGTSGLAEAADYISLQLANAGLAPGGPAGSYFQPFEMPVSISVAHAELRQGDELFTRGRDFEALLVSGNDAVKAPLVFAGYGISAPKLGYDDYAQVDVEGRVVLVLEDRPPGAASGVSGPAGVGFLRRAHKIANARRRGARAILIAPSRELREPSEPGSAGDPGLPADAGREWANPTQPGAGIAAIAVSRGAAERLMRASGGPGLAARQRQIDATAQPGSEVLRGVDVGVVVTIARTRETVRNVVGVLPGRDPALRHEAVVVGAHYDHLGHGEFSSLAPSKRGEVHNGANDNASGTAGILELARVFGNASPGRRTLVLIAFSAEEAGLGGSSEYVRQPTGIAPDTVAMINLDMIGRLEDGELIVFGAETSPDFPRLVSSASSGIDLDATFVEGGHAPSDQTSFYAQDIPVLFFFTGSHIEYHTPDDDPDLVNAAGTVSVLQTVYRTTRALLDAPRAPLVKAGSPLGHGGATGAPGYGPYLGTIPDFSGGREPGVLLQGVRQRSPADIAGLRAGDRIVAFDGAEIANLEEYSVLLFEARAGDAVSIVVLRGDDRITTVAILGRRR